VAPRWLGRVIPKVRVEREAEEIVDAELRRAMDQELAAGGRESGEPAR